MKSRLNLSIFALMIIGSGLGCRTQTPNEAYQLRDIELLPPSDFEVRNFEVIQNKSHQDPAIEAGFEKQMPHKIRAEFSIDERRAQFLVSFPEASEIEAHLWDLKIEGAGRCVLQKGRLVVLGRAKSTASSQKVEQTPGGFMCELFTGLDQKVSAVFAELPSGGMVIQVNVSDQSAVYHVRLEQ